MAEIVLSAGSICRPYRSPWGAFPIKHCVPISTNSRIDVGRPVTLNWTVATTQTGQIVQSTADNTFFLVGIAGSSLAAGSSAVANPAIPVYEANPNVEFRAFTKGGAVTSSIVGLNKTLHWDSTLAIAYVDITASTATDWRVVVTGMAGENGQSGLVGQIGDTGAEVTFRFMSHLTDNIASSVALTSTSPILAFYR